MSTLYQGGSEIILQKRICRTLTASIVFPAGIWLFDLLGFYARPLHFSYAFSIGLLSAFIFLTKPLNKTHILPIVVITWPATLLLCLCSEILSRFLAGIFGYVSWWADIIYHPSVLDTLLWAISSAINLQKQDPLTTFLTYSTIAFPLITSVLLQFYRVRFSLQFALGAIPAVAFSLSVVTWLGIENIERKFALRLTVIIATTFPLIMWQCESIKHNLLSVLKKR